MTFTRREHSDGGHHYQDDDQRVRGVTTWLNLGYPKPALIDWAAKATARYAVNEWDTLAHLPPADRYDAVAAARWAVNAEAKATGKDLHSIAELLAKGEAVEAPEALWGMADQFARWLDDYGVTILATEMPVLNRRYGYAGTLDGIATIGGHRCPLGDPDCRWLWDTKTGKSVYADTALQLAAYANAEVCLWDGTERPMPKVQHCAVLHVMPDDYTFSVAQVTAHTFDAYLAAQEVGRWRATYDDPKHRESSPIGPRVAAPHERQPLTEHWAARLRDLGWTVQEPAA